jgi:hypothetical protein
LSLPFSDSAALKFKKEIQKIPCQQASQHAKFVFPKAKQAT